MEVIATPFEINSQRPGMPQQALYMHNSYKLQTIFSNSTEVLPSKGHLIQDHITRCIIYYSLEKLLHACTHTSVGLHHVQYRYVDLPLLNS